MKDFTYSVYGVLNNQNFLLSQDATFEEAVQLSADSDFLYDSIHIEQEHVIVERFENMLVVSDTKGMLWETKQLLDPRPLDLKEQIIFLGNFIGTNESFLSYLSYLLLLKKTRNLVFVKGKTEHDLMEYVHQTFNYIGLNSEVETLIHHIEEECGFCLTELPTQMPEVYHLLNNALPFYETDAYIFVSGEIDLSSNHWRNAHVAHFFSTTPEFLIHKNQTNKTIVFGNLAVSSLNKDALLRPYINRKQQKIGINGNVEAFGRLIGMLIHGEDQSFIGIRHQSTRNVAEAYIGNDELLFQ